MSAGTPTAATRRRTLAALLALTLCAVGWVAASDEDGADAPVTAAARPVRAAAAPASSSTEAAWPAPPADRAAGPEVAPAPAAWGLPPAPPPAVPASPPARAAAVAPPGPPQAPPFPYTWIGRVDDGSQSQALLEGPSRTLSVKPSDVIDGQWRVDAVDAQGVRLTWLPGRQSVQVTRPLS